jgi:hypothetical protein
LSYAFDEDELKQVEEAKRILRDPAESAWKKNLAREVLEDFARGECESFAWFMFTPKEGS